MAAIHAGPSARQGAAALVVATLACTAAGLHAQPANPFVGSWQATFTIQRTRGLGTDERQADLVITPTGGTWHARVRTGTDPCVGREVPLAIEELTDSSLTATVRYSTLSDLCKDVKLVLQRDDSGKVSGRRGNTALTLERK